MEDVQMLIMPDEDSRGSFEEFETSCEPNPQARVYVRLSKSSNLHRDYKAKQTNDVKSYLFLCRAVFN